MGLRLFCKPLVYGLCTGILSHLSQYWKQFFHIVCQKSQFIFFQYREFQKLFNKYVINKLEAHLVINYKFIFNNDLCSVYSIRSVVSEKICFSYFSAILDFLISIKIVNFVRGHPIIIQAQFWFSHNFCYYKQLFIYIHIESHVESLCGSHLGFLLSFSFSIQSCRSCYARLYLCQRPIYKILVKVRNSKKNVLKNVLIILNINKDENKSLISNQFSLKNDLWSFFNFLIFTYLHKIVQEVGGDHF